MRTGQKDVLLQLCHWTATRQVQVLVLATVPSQNWSVLLEHIHITGWSDKNLTSQQHRLANSSYLRKAKNAKKLNAISLLSDKVGEQPAFSAILCNISTVIGSFLDTCQHRFHNLALGDARLACQVLQPARRWHSQLPPLLTLEPPLAMCCMYMANWASIIGNSDMSVFDLALCLQQLMAYKYFLVVLSVLDFNTVPSSDSPPILTLGSKLASACLCLYQIFTSLCICSYHVCAV